MSENQPQLQLLEQIANEQRKQAVIAEEALRLQERAVQAQDTANLVAFYQALKQPNHTTSKPTSDAVQYLEQTLVERFRL